MPYPPPPGPRIAYDTNGSIVLLRGASAVVQEAKYGINYMNSERATYGTSELLQFPALSPQDQYLAILFPVPMRLYAIFCVSYHAYLYGGGMKTLDMSIYTAPDTTNGDDGTWNFIQKIAHQESNGVTGPGSGMNIMSGVIDMHDTPMVVNDVYRRSQYEGGPTPISGQYARHVRGLRFVPSGHGSNPANQMQWKIHLYGEPDTDASENILVFWDPEDDLSAAGDLLDWGDVPQGSTADKAFRVKNNSSAQTANTIVVNAQMGQTTTDPVPSDSLLFSLNGTTWTPSVSIAALSPGAVSGQIRVRRTTPLNAQPSNWAPRVVATVGSWS